jgi:nucleotide-binding universal stress UspA family protein
LARDPLARTWDPVAEGKEIKEKLQVEASRVPDGIKADVRVVLALEGDTASLIQQVADDENSSLVVIGARGRGRIVSSLLGSISKDVLRYGNSHVLIMRYKTLASGEMSKFCEKIFSKVLIPIDFSGTSEYAISYLNSLPGINEVLVLSVVSKGETDEQLEANLSKVRKQMDDLASMVDKSGRKANYRVEVGHPAEKILEMAKKEDVSLIAMSAQGAKAMKEHHIGSTAYDVANNSDRPVLILRPTKMAMS